MSIPSSVRIVVFDMDGVLWSMDDPIPHASEALERCRLSGRAVYFLTNNSSKTRDDYVAKLARFGIRSNVDEVVTSAQATAQWLKARNPAGNRRAVIIGEEGLRRELEAVGVQVVNYREGDTVDYVVVGWDRSLTYDKLAQAHGAIVRGGALFVATNRDATYPFEGGRTLPGGGSIVAAVATSTGIEPITIGKPEQYTMQMILDREHAAPEECLVVGDRLDTDIALAVRTGALSALVLTGVSTEAEARGLPPDQQPTYIWPNLSHL
ncbi:MAG: HAD-IIA family hydrolase [Chthonomonadales bacterium]|nr:HAD-IIA family hydrolase [Chthonomonadales bacterium]